MSYILDALKKSEEERKKGDLPGLQTYTPTTGAPSGKKVWVVVVVVLVATNIIGLFIWAPWQTAKVLVKEIVPPSTLAQPINAPSIPVRQRSPHIEPVAKAIAKPVVKQAPSKFTVKPKAEAVVEPSTEINAEPVAQLPSQYRDTPASEVKISPNPKEEYRQQATPSTAYLPQVSELPQSIQTQIPDLTFSSHMYSSQERFRSITINGKRLKQGRYYNEKLYVNEITEKGAVMGFEGTLFEVDVLGQWGN